MHFQYEELKKVELLRIRRDQVGIWKDKAIVVLNVMVLSTKLGNYALQDLGSLGF